MYNLINSVHLILNTRMLNICNKNKNKNFRYFLNFLRLKQERLKKNSIRHEFFSHNIIAC